MLTTVACATIRSDREMLKSLNRDVTPNIGKINNILNQIRYMLLNV